MHPHAHTPRRAMPVYLTISIQNMQSFALVYLYLYLYINAKQRNMYMKTRKVSEVLCFEYLI